MNATTSTDTTTSRATGPATTGTGYTELNALLDRAARGPVRITDAQLLALQYRWTAALSARLDQTIELAGTEPLADAVAQTWRRLARELPTLRAVLDGQAGAAALADGQAVELRMLALAAGLVGVDEPTERAAGLGHALRELIRAGHTTKVAELVA